MTAGSTPTRYRYQPIITRQKFLWPNKAVVAVWIIPNVEYYPFGNIGPSINESASSAATDVLNNSWRDYGPRVGIWRLIDCFDRLGVKISATLNSDVCDQYPEIVEAGSRRSWEWIGHGTNNSVRLSDLNESDERSLIQEATSKIATTTGRRPEGWLGPGLGESSRTPEILAANGYRYVCDWIADDLPMWLSTRSGKLLSLPYSIELNDMQLIFRQRMPGDAYRQSLTDHFEQLKREGLKERRGRVLAIPLHPFLTGQARYVMHLERALDAVVSSKHSWVATGSEIAKYYVQQVGAI